eukprot:1197062-Prymnesium_polylepis.1
MVRTTASRAHHRSDPPRHHPPPSAMASLDQRRRHQKTRCRQTPWFLDNKIERFSASPGLDAVRRSEHIAPRALADH